MTNQCKAEIRRKDEEKKTIRHLCGRQRSHEGRHECYCGATWQRQSEELCQSWRANTTARYDEAKPNKFRVTPEREINLYGERRIELDQAKEEE